MEDFEKSFLRDNVETGRMICIAGTQGSGKTYFATSFMKISIMHELYDLIIFISPTLNKEKDDQYEFMKTNKAFILYEEYDDSIIKMIEELTLTKRVLLVCDDASAYLMKNKYSSDLYELATCVRHGKGCTVILFIHALTNVLTPNVRAILNYLFIGNYGNQKTLRGIFDEHLSMQMKFEDFKLPV